MDQRLAGGVVPAIDLRSYGGRVVLGLCRYGAQGAGTLVCCVLGKRAGLAVLDGPQVKLAGVVLAAEGYSAAFEASTTSC